MRIEIWNDTKIETYSQIVEAFYWCKKTMGDPGERWTYGKAPGFLGSDFVNSPEEIEYFDFYNDEDAVAFKLRY